MAAKWKADEMLPSGDSAYRVLFENNPEPMWVLETATQAFLEVNEAAVRLYGYSREEFLTMAASALCPEESTGEPSHCRIAKHRKKDGSVIDVGVKCREIEFAGKSARIVVASQIWPSACSGGRIGQAEKTQAIGTLAAGIVHDINNILAVILGHTEMGIAQVPRSAPIRHDLEQIHNAVDKAKELMKQVLAFSLHGQQYRKPIDLGSVIKEALDVFSSFLPETMEIRREIEHGIAFADAGLIKRVVLNLLTNAAQAMNNRGVAGIRLVSVELAANSASGIPGLGRGAYWKLSASDTGCGMDEATAARAFDPYFTTREVGQGRGLGLAVVRGIVTHHGGCVTLRSEVGKGTTVDVYLPRLEVPGTDPAP